MTEPHALPRIDVRTYGVRGPQVVVLHGGPGAPGSAAGLGRSLGSQFRALEPLQRRSGGVPLTVARHVADLAEVAPRSAALVGWSWGAMLALSFAAAHPDRVRSIALVACGTYDEASRGLCRRDLDARLGAEGQARMAALRARLAGLSDPAARDRVVDEIGALVMRAEAYDPLPGDDDGALPADSAGHDETWRDVLRLQSEGAEPAAFARIRVPVRMFHGAVDPHPGPATRDVLARHIPQLEYLEFKRCGHTPWQEREAREPFRASLSAWISAPAG